MTHEYVIAVGGHIEPRSALDQTAATAIGWAADAVLAVGPDAVVRSISRGDSTFVDLAGCEVTPLPADPQEAAAVVHQANTELPGIGHLLVDAGLLEPGSELEPGSAADLAFWDRDAQGSPRLVAIVRGGAFTEGDEHYGPFRAAS